MICGSYENVEMRHVRKIRDLRSPNSRLDFFTRQMEAINRKQIPLCKAHHIGLHNNTWSESGDREIIGGGFPPPMIFLKKMKKSSPTKQRTGEPRGEQTENSYPRRKIKNLTSSASINPIFRRAEDTFDNGEPYDGKLSRAVRWQVGDVRNLDLANFSLWSNKILIFLILNRNRL